MIDSSDTDLSSLLREGRWDDVFQLYERGFSPEEKQRAEYRLQYAVALIRGGRIGSGFNLLTPEIVALPEARLTLRRYVVPFLIQERQLSRAVTILGLLISADPDSVEDLRLRGSLLGRSKDFTSAIVDARHVIDLRPNDLPGHTAYLQLLLQDGQIPAAASHAAGLGPVLESDQRLGGIGLLALTRGGLFDAAISLATALEHSGISDKNLPSMIVRTYLDAKRPDAAVESGERFLARGFNGAKLRAQLGQAYLGTERDDRYDRAIDHLTLSIEQEPVDAVSRAMLGEALLRTGHYAEATVHLGEACAAQPRVANSRALYARALKQSGRYGEAAREFRRLLKLQPSSHRWHRYAAGALSQAGKRDEAADLFDDFVATRTAALPDDFDQGLRALWDRVGEVEIPQARLDWAWSMRSDLNADRAVWERKARWGYLADHYLLDWLECKDTQVHEAMRRLADLADAEKTLGSVDSSGGMILASAHIGPMYAGPLALELMGVRSKWLASTPSVARTAYAKSLISTSDQAGVEVAKEVMKSVRQGYAVVIAVDGAVNLASPRVPFAGQEITYSSFAARAAHRLGVPSLFVAPRWEGDRIGFVIEQMPDPLPDEDSDSHAERWREAFLDSVRRFLGGAPENLRLGGGLWRHARTKG